MPPDTSPALVFALLTMPRLHKVLALLCVISAMKAGASSSNLDSTPCKDDTAWGEIRKDDTSATRAPPPFSPSRSRQANAEAKAIDARVEEVDISIVGGGLVGLSLAIGLTRAGIRCKVYERAPRLRSVSQGILAVKPLGMQALEAIHPDIPARVAEVGCERLCSVLTKVDADGNTEDVVDEHVGREDEAKYGRKRVGITWHNMQQVLASLLPPGVVQTGRGLSSFVEEDGCASVLLYFEGGEVVRCHAALMCDGVFSVARKQMFPDDRAIYFGQLNWGSVIETDSLPPGMHPPNAVRYCTYSGDPRWMAMLNDGGGGYTFFQLRISDSEKALALSGNQGRGGLGLPGALERLLPIVEPCKDVAAALAHIPEEKLFERCVVGRGAAPTWLSAGKRVALVGDSAHGMHPNIGQGANTGFESARNLIQDLKACNRDWKSGLGAFERAHKPRADLIQAFANLMGCVQSQQKELLPKEVVNRMLDWINTNDPTKIPPEDELDIVRTFNPLSQEGVRFI